MDTCVSLSGTIRTIDKNGQPIIVPGAQDEYYAAKCPLDFHPTTDGKCLVTVDTEGGKEKFILSNLSKAVLEDRNTVDDDTAVLYGSIGNTVQVEINGAKKELPIEPVGVMVLAIDGLRQDVLYPAGEQQVYPSGMQSPYYIEPDRLKGLCDIFGGKRGWLSCDPDGWENRHIRLQSVTAIFPSITLASWASIFTGMMPGTTLDSNGNNIGGTGILGNEFFARDLYGQNIGLPRYLDSTGVYQRKFNPEGIVSFGSGAFRGYDQYTHVEKLTDQSFFIPYQLNWEEPISPVRTATAQGTPQNDPAILRPQTIFESITGEPGMTDVKKYFKERGGDSVVVANNHYARGAYWLTWDLNLFFSSAETLDAQSWDKFDDYLKGKYTDGILGILGRNKIPFSALSVWYLPGLDHQAHVNGMGAYKNYFITTDTYIAELVDRLKKTLDEFDNKIFIIVADHGHTAMPLPEQMTLEEKATVRFYKKDANDVEEWYADLVGDSTQGQGKAVVSWGSLFDVQNRYEAVAALNPGTSAEVLSERKTVPLAQLKVLTDESTPQTPDEIKFGDGSNDKKRFKIELESRALMDTCVSLSGTIRTIDKNGQPIIVPGAQDEYYAAKYPLDFHPTLDNKCLVTVDTEGGKEKFILSNLSKAVLEDRNTVDDDTAVLYGGIGNTVQVEINGVKKDISTEPLGIIVLAIDGLRQDVLYAPQGSSDGTNVNVSYPDPVGCVTGNCYVQPADLKGLCDVLGGKYSDIFGFFGSCDPAGWEKRHVKLQNVTAIFPSITLASWASIFTGKMPGETGILGNEFFARDLIDKNFPWNPTTKINVPERYSNPSGMISLSSGAFKGYDTFGVFDLDDPDFFIPYRGYWAQSVDPDQTPQNARLMLKPDTLYESIVGRPAIEGMPDLPGIEEVKKYFSKHEGDPVVVANNHYARGARWLTWSLTWSWYGDSETMDKSGWLRLDEYLKGRYLNTLNTDGPSNFERNKVPFPALMVWYLPGLDHEAHILGMHEYKNYVIDDTDRYVKYLVDWLKEEEHDEFDNKIFIVVADHGMMAMPTDLRYERTQTHEDDMGIHELTEYPYAETSCKLNLDFDSSDAKEAERHNNNLHIWELGEVIAFFGKKALGPTELVEPVEITKGITKDLSSADIVATLNGPMAHIYVKGPNDWTSAPSMDSVLDIAEIFRLALKEGNTLPQEMRAKIPRLLASIDTILVRDGGQYKVLNGFDAHGAPQYSSIDSMVSPKFIEAKKRIIGMNHEKRSGDVVLLFRDEMEESTQSRHTSGVSCKSWHGGLNSSDSYVPFIVSYPGGNRFELEPIIEKPDVCGPQMACEGNWKTTDLIKAIIRTQYTDQ
jgi:predicted AlkP superfamily pyrophosphatase or phosphodiesterase